MSYQKKARNRISPVVIPVVLLLILAAVSVVCVVYQVMMKAAKTPAGVWERKISLSASAREKEIGWLSEAKMSEKAIDSLTGTIEDPSLILTLKKDGTYEQKIDPDSYGKMRELLYGEFEEVLRELIVQRVDAAGLSPLSKEEADRAFEEEFGMGIREYLERFGPVLVPELSELTAEYEAEGTWRIEEGMIIFNDAPGAEFLYDEKMLAIHENGEKEAVVYVRKNSEDK